jgi:fibronectin-binding autotransporter adhesin
MTAINYGGFERGDSSEAALSSGTFSISSSTVRTGTYALRCNPASSGQGYHGFQRIDSNGRPAYMGRTAETFYTFWFRFATLPASSATFASVINSGGTNVVSLAVSSGGAVTLVGTGSSSTIATVSTGTWYRMDMRVTSNGTSGAKIDGGSEQTATALNNTMDMLILGRFAAIESNTYDCFYDDWHIEDTAFPTGGKCYQLLPNGAGSSTAWASGTGSTFAEVDDVPGHDTDTTYIKALATGDNTSHMFAMQNRSDVSALGDVAAVKVSGMCRSESTSGTSAAAVLLTANGGGFSTNPVEWTTTYNYFATIASIQPNGGAPWTGTNVDGLQAGVEAGTLAQAQRCTQISAMIWVTGEASGDITGTCALAFGAGSSTLTGAGALAGTAANVFGAGSSNLRGAGALVGSCALTITPTATGTLVGVLAGTCALAITPTGTMTGAGALAGSSALVFDDGSSVLTGAGELAGSAALTFDDGASTLTGAGALAGSSALAFTNEGTLENLQSSELVGSVALAFTCTGTLTGSGALAGTAAITFDDGSSALTGAGALAGTSANVFGAGSSTLTGAGALAGTCSLAIAGTGTLTGAGALAGSAALVFDDGNSTLSAVGSGAMAGTVALAFACTGTPTGAGSLAGTSANAFAGTGTLTGAAALAGTVALTTGGTGTLAGSGLLAGVCSLAIEAAGTLINNAAVGVPGPYIDASQSYRPGSRGSDFIPVGARASQAYRPGSIAFDAIQVGSRASQGQVSGSQEGDYS